MESVKKTFVCGWPIEHSRSPLIHNFWIEKYQLNGSYEKIAVEPGKLAQHFSTLQDQGFAGGNITIPHKEEALKLVDRVERSARKIGAVNTVWFEDEKLIGDNTDWIGFSANLDQGAPGWDNPDAKEKTALVIGAGGAARGIIFALIDRGFKKVHLANRTITKAQNLADEFGSEIIPTNFEQMNQIEREINLVVNTTSLGMNNEGVIPIDFNRLSKSTIITDIVYTPLETQFLQTAKDHGFRTVDGLGMLLHQAAPGFVRWFGLKPDVDNELRQLIINDIQKA